MEILSIDGPVIRMVLLLMTGLVAALSLKENAKIRRRLDTCSRSQRKPMLCESCGAPCEPQTPSLDSHSGS